LHGIALYFVVIGDWVWEKKGRM